MEATTQGESTKDVQDSATHALKDSSIDEKKKELRFGASHALVVTFFLWLLFLQILGIYLFASGFLLTRLVLDHRSECTVPPIPLDGPHVPGTSRGCWHPKAFKKAVIIVIDALRYDFTVPFSSPILGETPKHCHNALTILHETAIEHPGNAVLLPFIADPPTTTLQRLKALTTGTLPTFVDAGSNFAGTAIDEDNLLLQLSLANKTIVQLGDDTWHALYPGFFEPNLTRPFDSFNVWDLHTVDNGVTEHLFPLLEPRLQASWDVIIGHYLGVDHAGHRYGPDHPSMTAKLQQMDEMLRQLVKSIDDDTLLVVFGDHGMDAKGDHGGESDDEVEAALWMYSKKAFFGRHNEESKVPPATAKTQQVSQIDLVPTLALLLGIPIPFNNLGSPIPQAFVGLDGSDYENLSRAARLTAAQVSRYLDHYRKLRALDAGVFSNIETAWQKATGSWETSKAIGTHLIPGYGTHAWKAVSLQFRVFQSMTLSLCRALWARFDLVSMFFGIQILAGCLAAVLLFACGIEGDRSELIPVLLVRSIFGCLMGSLSGFLLNKWLTWLPLGKTIACFSAMGGLLGLCAGFWGVRLRLQMPLPNSFSGWIGALLTLGLSGAFASNSFTIWEDQILLVFLVTLGAFLLAVSTRQKSPAMRAIGCYHAALFIILTRVASLSTMCREEQMPYCKTTFYASAASSTSSSWTLTIPYLLLVLLPGITKSYFDTSKSYHGTAPIWNGGVFRAGLALTALFWTLDVADDNNWLNFGESTLKTVKTALAQLVLVIDFAAGYPFLAYSAPFLDIRTVQRTSATEPMIKNFSDNEEHAVIVDGESAAIIVEGYRNIHGTRFFPLLAIWALAVLLLSKPLGQGAVGLMIWQIFCLLEILAANPHLRTSSIGPVLLAILGSFHFFKTGHNATLASIQWDTAFIPLKVVRYPWAPMVIILNTFGAQILCAIAVPLTQLWKVAPRKKGLLGDVARAMAQLVLFYAIIIFSTTLYAGHLRRHLMLYRVFMPRYLLAGAVGTIVQLIGAIIAIGSLRWSFVSVGKVFGWP